MAPRMGQCGMRGSGGCVAARMPSPGVARSLFRTTALPSLSILNALQGAGRCWERVGLSSQSRQTSRHRFTDCGWGYLLGGCAGELADGMLLGPQQVLAMPALSAAQVQNAVALPQVAKRWGRELHRGNASGAPGNATQMMRNAFRVSCCAVLSGAAATDPVKGVPCCSILSPTMCQCSGCMHRRSQCTLLCYRYTAPGLAGAPGVRASGTAAPMDARITVVMEVVQSNCVTCVTQEVGYDAWVLQAAGFDDGAGR
jgi:hypothetical protein